MSLQGRHGAGGPPAGHERARGARSLQHIRGDRDPIRGRRTARVGMEKGAHMTSAQVDNEYDEHGGKGALGGDAPGEGYERGLGSRQVQMIAIGGAIGVGLFLGAGSDEGGVDAGFVHTAPSTAPWLALSR